MASNFISSVWDFSQPTLDPLHPIHGYFRWYGKLPQLLVRRMLRLYSKKDDLVFANFAGSGTVLIEANLANRPSVGVDSSPLSYLLCKVKTNPITFDVKPFIEEVKEALRSRKKKPLFKIREAKKWFYEQSLIDLQIILDQIRELEKGKIQDFFLMAFTNIIRRASKVDSRCINHIVVDKNKPRINVFREFSDSAGNLQAALKKFSEKKNDIRTDIFLADARKADFLEDKSADLIISHPPYLRQILYYNIYRLENELLGFDYNEVRNSDISTNSLFKYLRSMRNVFDEMYRVLKPRKYCCVIIGDTREEGDIIPTFKYFVDYGIKTGFRLRDIFIWVQSRKAGMNVARRGNYIDHNYILIFQK